MNFYRYESVEYATVDFDGEYISSPIPNPKVELKVFSLFKETKKGYWIGYGGLGGLCGIGRWVSKTARKRYAYPTKKEALDNFIKRNEVRKKILNRQSLACEISISIAKEMNID